MIGIIVAVVVIFSMFIASTFKQQKALGASKVGENLPLTPKTPPLSTVASKVLAEYNTLPVESRPFDNIKDILASLDAITAHLGKDRENHFDDNYQNRVFGGYSSENLTKFKFSWGAASVPRPDSYRYLSVCSHKDCAYTSYFSLYKEIQAVKKALDDKMLAMVRSDNAHNVTMAGELVKALREEAKVNREVTVRLNKGELG